MPSFTYHRVRPKDVPKWVALGWQALPPRRGTGEPQAMAEIRWYGKLPYPAPAGRA